MKHSFLFFLALLSLMPASAAAEMWTTLLGQKFEGRLGGVYGEMVVISLKNGSYTVQLDSLDDDSLRRVAAFVAQPAPPSTWAASSSKVAKALNKRLQVLQGNKLVPFDPGARSEPEFYLVYFGAYWCGPCRRFSPGLVTAYERMKTHAPDRFEVIFVSDDVDSAGQLKYVREVNMPWPVLKMSSVGKVPVFDQWRGDGIPCLVVLTREGDLIFHSYNGKTYLGADDPLEKFEALLAASAPGSAPPRRPSLHRFAIAQHLNAAVGGDRPPQPYLIELDPRKHRTLPSVELKASLQIDAKGQVITAEFTPKLDAVSEDALTRAAEHWLFLPAVRSGKAAPTALEFPIDLTKK